MVKDPEYAHGFIKQVRFEETLTKEHETPPKKQKLGKEVKEEVLRKSSTYTSGTSQEKLNSVNTDTLAKEVGEELFPDRMPKSCKAISRLFFGQLFGYSLAVERDRLIGLPGRQIAIGLVGFKVCNYLLYF